MLNSITRLLSNFMSIARVFNTRFKLQFKVVECSEDSKVKVLTLDSVNITTIVDSLLHALEGSSNPLVVVPGSSLGSVIKRLRRDVDVVSYGDLREVTVYDRIVVLLPEIYLRSTINPPISVEDLLKALRDLRLCSDKVILVSRVFSDSSSLEARVDIVEKRFNNIAGYLAEEALALFNKLYPGLTPNAGQVVSLRILAGMIESGGSLITVMPTGSGKTAIFHVASRLSSSNGLGSYTLVVTPLRALMRDHVYRAMRRGLKAAYIDSSIPRESREEIYSLARRGLLDLLYVAPERFWDPVFRAFIKSERPSLIVLDEIHVMTNWGSTFRPSYLNVAKTIASYRANGFKPPLLGLSATLTMENAREILSLLGHREEPVVIDLSRGEPRYVNVDPKVPVIVKASPLRDNLVFDVVMAPVGFERLRVLIDVVKDMMEEYSGYDNWVGIIFTGYAESKAVEWANVDVIAKALKDVIKMRIIAYHGELGERARRKVEDLLARGSVGNAIVVATKAFGMGVDIPNVRWVILYTPSDSIEDLYQEAGRAGRDGREAKITILYNPADVEFKKRLSRASRLRPSYVLRVNNTIARLAENLPRDHSYIILPLGVFKYKVYALKALEVIRGMGLLDYYIVRSSKLTLSNQDRGVYMKIDDSRYVALDGEGVEVEVYACRNSPLYYPVTLKARGEVLLQTGKCPGSWIKVTDNNILVIEVTGDIKFNKTLEPHVFLEYVRSWVVEEESLDSVMELLEGALAAKSREPKAVNEVVKEYILRYFERRRDPVRVPETPLVIKCRGNCYEEASFRIWSLVKSCGGPQSVTIFYESPWDPGELAKTYQRITGLTLNVKMRRIERLLMLISRGGWERLLDEGYIVVLSRRGSRLERLANALEGYRYHITIVYDS